MIKKIKKLLFPKKLTVWEKIQKDFIREDEEWFVDSRGQGILNVAKVLNSEQGQKLLSYPITMRKSDN